MMMKVALATMLVAAASAFDGAQQARLDDLLQNTENAELASLLAEDARDRRADKADLFTIEHELEALQTGFENAVGEEALADVIAAAVNDTLSGDDVLLALIRDQTELEAAVLAEVAASVAANDAEIKDFGDVVVARIKTLTDAVDTEIANRKLGEGALDKRFKEFSDVVTEKLKVVDDLPDTVGKQVDDALKPLTTGVAILDAVKLTYVANPKTPTFRWQWWHTYDQSFGWFDGNEGRSFGGVRPHDWTDGNHRAWDMNADFKFLKRLFVRQNTAPTYGATICAECYFMYSSTTGRMCGVVFRIKNIKSNGITWRPEWMYTSFSGWSEDASASMNGASNFRDHCNGSFCRNRISFNVPANNDKNRVSTIIFVSSGTNDYHVGYNRWERANINMFNDNSLALPNGLEYVDDMDTVKGSWKD